jgi:hypothetical protein
MLTLLIKKFTKLCTKLIAAFLIVTSFTTITQANEEQYINYYVGQDCEREFINLRIENTIETFQMRQCDVIVRVGEYQGKSGKRIYINNQKVNIPNDIPIRNDGDGKGFYISEWDINLKEAEALVKKLRAQGINAIAQISYDKTTDLNAAGRLSNKSNPYLYISLHHNYFDSNSEGYFAMHNSNDRLGEYVAKRLSNSIKNNGMVKQRCNRENTGYIGEMNAIHSGTTPVLLELGFFSNISELENICSDKYVDYVSTNLANEIVDIINTDYK